jgi:hypothetical protein
VKVKPSVRNVVIIVVLAAIVGGVSAGQTAASTAREAVSLGFLTAFGWIASRLYREHRTTLYSLGTQRRTILYCAVGLAVLTLSAYDRLTATGLGAVIWVLLLFGSGYAIYAVYRSAKQY